MNKISFSVTAPTTYPLEVRGVGTSPSTLSITWQPLPPINHNGPGLYYVVYHQRADGKGRLFRSEVKNVSSFVVMGADYYVKYMIQLQAANDVGFGPKSPVVFGYSGEKSEYFVKLLSVDFSKLLSVVTLLVNQELSPRASIHLIEHCISNLRSLPLSGVLL